MFQRRGAVVGVMLGVCAAEQAFALGTGFFSSELISTRSLGEGGVGVAGASQDPTAVYTNPAALTSLPGLQITTGITYLNARPTYTDDAGEVTGARATSVLVPDFAVTTQLLDGRLSAGLAIVSPYGAETHFDGDSALRYAATDSRLRMADITPAVAYKVNEVFSVGVGADFYDVLDGSLAKKLDTADLNYDVAYNGLGAALGPLGPIIAAGYRTGADSNSQLSATGTGWGYHAGVTIKPNEENQIGVTYHSNVRIGLSGTVQLTGLSGFVVSNPFATVFGSPNFTATATAPLFIPQNVQLGYAFMPNKKWKIEVDGAWYDWYDARQIGIVYQGLTPNQSAVLNDPSNNPILFHPRNTFSTGLGVNYKQNDRLQWRGGFYYQGSSTAEDGFDPGLLDMPRYGLTAGAGYQLTKSTGLDLAYESIFFHTRYVTYSSTQTPVPLTAYSGYFDAFAQVISASLTYRTDFHF